MSPLIKALKNRQVVPVDSPQRSVLVITSPDVSQFPQALTNSNTNVAYSQNVYNLLLGIRDNQALKGLWDNLETSIALYQITDVIFLGYYPCSFLERVYKSSGKGSNSSIISDELALLRDYMRSLSHTRDTVVSKRMIYRLLDTNRKAFEAYPSIRELLEKRLLNVHSWILDHEKQQTFLFSQDKNTLVQLEEFRVQE